MTPGKILEDLDLAEDFFSYFGSTQRLLCEDPTIWCVSAWNDNGSPLTADYANGDRLYRTDFFPGLGMHIILKIWNCLVF